MRAALISDSLWDVIEPLLPLPKPKPRGDVPVSPIECVSRALCLFFAVAFLGRCCRRS